MITKAQLEAEIIEAEHDLIKIRESIALGGRFIGETWYKADCYEQMGELMEMGRVEALLKLYDKYYENQHLSEAVKIKRRIHQLKKTAENLLNIAKKSCRLTDYDKLGTVETEIEALETQLTKVSD